MNNSVAFYDWLESFIVQYIDVFSNHFVLGYAILDIIIGCTIIKWLLSKLRLASSSTLHHRYFAHHHDRRDAP